LDWRDSMLESILRELHASRRLHFALYFYSRNVLVPTEELAHVHGTVPVILSSCQTSIIDLRAHIF